MSGHTTFVDDFLYFPVRFSILIKRSDTLRMVVECGEGLTVIHIREFLTKTLES